MNLNLNVIRINNELFNDMILNKFIPDNNHNNEIKLI